MMNKIYIVLLFFISVSCTKEIEIEIPNKEPSFVVNSLITPFTLPMPLQIGIELQSSSHIFDTTKKELITDALVLYFENNIIKDTLNYYEELGFYLITDEINDYPIVGNEYSIQISKDGYKTVTAKTIIPNKVEIKDTSLVLIAFFDEDDMVYSEVTINFTDPADKINYYEVAISKITQDYYYEISSNNKIITTESYYPSLFEFDKNKPKTLLFSDKLINGKNVDLSLFYPPPYYVSDISWIPFNYISVHLRNVTEDYYKNKTTYLQHTYSQQENILYGMGEPINVYSNIENGHGVFAGYNSSIVSFQIDSTVVK